MRLAAGNFLPRQVRLRSDNRHFLHAELLELVQLIQLESTAVRPEWADASDKSDKRKGMLLAGSANIRLNGCDAASGAEKLW
jgi:hypothetical protein